MWDPSWGKTLPRPAPRRLPSRRVRPALPRGGSSSLPRCLPPPPSSQRPPHLPSYSPLSLLPQPLPAPAPCSAPRSRAEERRAFLNGPRPLAQPGRGCLPSPRRTWSAIVEEGGEGRGRPSFLRSTLRLIYGIRVRVKCLSSRTVYFGTTFSKIRQLSKKTFFPSKF